MKRPIAEFLIMTVKEGAEAARAQSEHEAWQILRRKQGYVAHRIYQHHAEPLRHLVYSEWESAKAVDGARQHLQGTPLMRRARGALAAAPQRQLMDLVGPITSTKGISLAEGAVAALAMLRLTNEDAGPWRAQEEQLWKALSGQPGYLSHVLLRGCGDPDQVGSFSHWGSAEAFEQAVTQLDAVVVAGAAEVLKKASGYSLYRPLRD